MAPITLAREGRVVESGNGFSALLRAFRQQAGRSQSALARLVGVDASYINRLESGEREPPRRSLIEALAMALELRPEDRDRLLVAAGQLPGALARLGPRDSTLSAVAEVLSDEALTEDERREFRRVVEAIAARWRRSTRQGERGAA